MGEKSKVGVALSQELATDLRVLAAKRGCTVTSIVTECLQSAVANADSVPITSAGGSTFKVMMVVPVELWTEVKVAAARRRSRVNAFVEGALRSRPTCSGSATV